MREAVLRVLNEPSYRRNAERLAESFSRLRGAGRAAELAAKLLPDHDRRAEMSRDPER